MSRNKFSNEIAEVQEKISNGLFEKKIHFLCGEIDQENVTQAIKWIIFENNLPDKNHLTLFVNSRGGNVSDAFALIDIMKLSKKPIATIGIGNIMSSAFLIFISGNKGQRYIAKNTSVMCHQYYDELGGKHHDLKASIKELDYTNERMMKIIVESSGLTPSFVKKNILTPSDIYLSAEEMLEMGFSDHILLGGDQF